jgi:hypothetical protein
LQELWTLTRISTNQKGGYVVRHCLPADCEEYAERFDVIMGDQAKVAFGGGLDPSTDRLAAYRLRADPLFGGLGLSSLKDGRHAAFLGAVSATIPSFLGAAGVLDRPCIERRIGRASFAEGAAGGWRQYFDSGSQVGAAAEAAWALAAQQVPARYPGDLRALHLAAADMPTGGGLQAAVAADLAKLQHERVHDEMRRLPPSDRRRTLFFNSYNRESVLFLMALPGKNTGIPPIEWSECVARVLGLHSPACAFAAGSEVPAARNRARQYLDPFGDALTTSTAMQGDGVAAYQHDPVVQSLCYFARAYGCTQAKAEDSDTFGSILRSHPGEMRRPEARHRTRTVTVDLKVALDTPDAQSVEHLHELKTVHNGPARYGALRAERNVAVETRAKALPAERRREIRATDVAVFGTPAGQVGPMETRLNTFPTIVGIVTGAFGEWSQSLIDLLARVADMGAAAWQRKLGAPSVAAARSTLLKRMRSQLGVCVARGHAKLVIERARSLPAQLARRAHGGAGANAPRQAPAGAHDADGSWHRRFATGSAGSARGGGNGRRTAAC